MSAITRNSASHKGDNGTIAIIGGSPTMHGAPIFAAKAAEASGVDLIHVCVPVRHAEVTKHASLNFIVHPFVSDSLCEADVEPLLELLAVMDCAVIGPGIVLNEVVQHVLSEIIAGAACPLVLDAAALSAHTLHDLHGKQAILTPHLGELERMCIEEEYLADTAKQDNVTIILKGEIDTIALRNGTVQMVHGGNAGLTVGGTGDALAGLIGGLVSQGIDHTQSCIMASHMIKRAGTKLYHTKGYAYTTEDVIGEMPGLLHSLEI